MGNGKWRTKYHCKKCGKAIVLDDGGHLYDGKTLPCEHCLSVNVFRPKGAGGYVLVLDEEREVYRGKKGKLKIRRKKRTKLKKAA